MTSRGASPPPAVAADALRCALRRVVWLERKLAEARQTCRRAHNLGRIDKPRVGVL